MKKILSTAMIAGILGGAAYLANTNDAVASEDKEKCYGVVKAGKNDCGNIQGTHSCAGNSTVDGDAGEWLLLPKGLCDRLVGGMDKEAATAKVNGG